MKRRELCYVWRNLTRLLSMKLLLCLLSVATIASTWTLRAAEAVGGVVKEPYAVEISVANEAAQLVTFARPAGTLWQTPAGEKLVSLRAVDCTVPPRTSATFTIPVAALSPKFLWKAGEAVNPAPAGEEESRLRGLLAYLATRNDVPRETSQLAVLALLGNISFGDWQRCRASFGPVPKTETPPASAGAVLSTATLEVASALDAVSLLRAVAPSGEFALASDPALKLRALHDPILRPKALQLYGLTIPGDAVVGGVAPDLGQLMHTKPGDNCPICRLRAQMQPPADAP